MNTPNDHAAEFTLSIVKALFSDDLSPGIYAATRELSAKGLTITQVNSVCTITIGHLAAYIFALTPEGVAKQRLRAAVASATTFTDLNTALAIHTYPGRNRTTKKGRRK